MQEKSLNKGQEAASVSFFDFLLSDEKCMIIDGPGGVGKTFLMGHLINKVMPSYHSTCKLLDIPCEYHSVEMTATTNKAAEVLSSNIGKAASTIHSFLGLKVYNDYNTGETIISQGNNYKVRSNIILFIDECSYIDRKLWEIILGATYKSKVIFVGDEYQLSPVKEGLSPIYNQNYRTARLTEPMRNAEQPILVDLCNQMRETVKTGIFLPIQPFKGVIDHFDAQQMEQAICTDFANQTDDQRILAYSNKQVQDYNEFIRQIRQLPPEITVGEKLVNNSAIELSSSKRLSVEEEVTVTDIDETVKEKEFSDGGNFFYQDVVIRTKFGEALEVMIPTDKAHFQALLKYYQSQKVWVNYFHMKNTYPDLRPKDAATVHKAQGSTYKTVYIDMANLSRCNQPDQTARLLNVAVSRPTTRIVMYGELSQKYGGILPYDKSN